MRFVQSGVLLAFTLLGLSLSTYARAAWVADPVACPQEALHITSLTGNATHGGTSGLISATAAQNGMTGSTADGYADFTFAYHWVGGGTPDPLRIVPSGHFVGNAVVGSPTAFSKVETFGLQSDITTHGDPYDITPVGAVYAVPNAGNSITRSVTGTAWAKAVCMMTFGNPPGVNTADTELWYDFE